MYWKIETRVENPVPFVTTLAQPEGIKAFYLFHFCQERPEILFSFYFTYNLYIERIFYINN